MPRVIRYIQEFLQTSFLRGSTKVYKKATQATEALQPYFKESKGTQGSVVAFLQDSPSKNFFPMSRLTQERRKVSTNELPTRRVYDSLVSFLSYKSLNSRKQRIFIQQATYKGNAQCVLNQEFLFLVHEYWV